MTRFQGAFDHAAIGMGLEDPEGRSLEINRALCRITGRSRDEMMATTLEALTLPEDRHLDARSREDLLVGGISSFQVEKRLRHALGHAVWVLMTVALVPDDEGRPLYLISQVQDISKRRELTEHLEHLVDHDFLTGLFNRRRFEQEVTKEAQRVSRYGSPGAMVLVDLDNFKDVNDALGHKAGDDLLVAVAGALRERMRQTDVLARIGGDEFAVLLPQTDAEQARVVADGIAAALRDRVAATGDPSTRVTASVGVALLDGHTAAKLMDDADLALYEAKAAGRDRVALYRPSSPHV